MKYTLESVRAEFEAKGKVKCIFFWGHTNSTNQINKSCFSQWYPSTFEVDGILFPSTEHWMMAQKAKLFEDEIRWQKIIEAKSPAEAKKYGRQVLNFEQDKWETNRFSIVVQGNYHKFKQLENLRTFLLQTNNRILVEASPVDSIWGIGKAPTDPGIEDPNNWSGENLLGFALMEVRDLLMKQ